MCTNLPLLQNHYSLEEFLVGGGCSFDLIYAEICDLRLCVNGKVN